MLDVDGTSSSEVRVDNPSCNMVPSDKVTLHDNAIAVATWRATQWGVVLESHDPCFEIYKSP